MPYTMTLTTNHQAIGEQEHCKGHVIRFVGIDSCIGIIARKGAFLTAAHLVQVSKESKRIAPEDVPSVVSVFDEKPYDEVFIVGQVSGWSQLPFFSKLMGDPVWNQQGSDESIDINYESDNRGTIRADTTSGAIRITYFRDQGTMTD